MDYQKLVDELTDNAIAILVVGSGIIRQNIPEWHIAAIGLVMAYYFMKKN